MTRWILRLCLCVLCSWRRRGTSASQRSRGRGGGDYPAVTAVIGLRGSTDSCVPWCSCCVRRGLLGGRWSWRASWRVRRASLQGEPVCLATSMARQPGEMWAFVLNNEGGPHEWDQRWLIGKERAVPPLAVTVVKCKWCSERASRVCSWCHALI